MIQDMVTAWDKARDWVKSELETKHPADYESLVTLVVQGLNQFWDDDYRKPDPERIKEINWGDYRGTLVYVIGATGYKPRDFWVVTVGYGSCSGCDSLDGIESFRSVHDDDGGVRRPTDEQVSQYMTLATHIVQGLTKI